MLNPKENLIDFGKQISPPDGYELSYAIGTTYSLDLEMLMIIPVALFYAQELDVTVSSFRYDMLDSITRASEKISVYCQKGKIKVPNEYLSLFSFWEKGIEQIIMPSKFQSFHPKVWVIRFESETKAPIYRLIITSRNLTACRDWDVAFATDGEVGDKEIPANKPLLDFLEFLSESGKRKIPKQFIQELSMVDFWVPEGFNYYKFHPIGVKSGNETYQNPLYKKEFDQLLAMSPFVQDDIIELLWENTYGDMWLLSRKEELDTLKEETHVDLDAFQFSKFIEEGERKEDIGEDDTDSKIQNFHAKLFIGLKNDSPYWYLGSANASNPAFGRNMEFMVELKGDYSVNVIKPKYILNLLTTDKKTDFICFEPYNSEKKVDQEKRKKYELQLRGIIYDLTCLQIEGSVRRNEENNLYDYSFDINARDLMLPEHYIVKFKPLCEHSKKASALVPGEVIECKEFTHYSEVQLTSFMVWEIYLEDDDKEELLKGFIVQMDIDLPSSRLGKVFTSILDSKEKFLKYLTFILNGDEAEVINLNVKKTGNGNMSGNENEINGIPVFEKLMLAASRNPKKLGHINEIIQKLKSEAEEGKESVISAEFENFWNIFYNYAERAK